MSKLWGQPLEVCPENMANVQRTGLKTCPYVCSVSFNVGVTCPQVTRSIHNRAAVTRRRATGTEAPNKLNTRNQAPFPPGLQLSCGFITLPDMSVWESRPGATVIVPFGYAGNY